MDTLFGIDLGGTKIEGIVLEATSGKVLARHRMPTEAEHGYEHILSRIKLLVAELSRQTGLRPKSIGMGTPGTTEPTTGKLKNSNTVCLNGKTLEKDCAELLKIPVITANDANCFALAESAYGAVKDKFPDGAECVFGIIMGTGVGGGIVVNGRVLAGHHGLGGEWGHNVIQPQGTPCYCGKAGCLETVISGPALEKYYQSLGGQKLGLKEITARTQTDQNAAKTIVRLVEFFSLAAAKIINIIDPTAIVLGGGVGNIDALYTQDTRAEILKHVFNEELKTLILRPALGDSAGVFGAAELTQKA